MCNVRVLKYWCPEKSCHSAFVCQSRNEEKANSAQFFPNDFKLPVISEQVQECVFLMDNKWRPSELFMVLKKF